MTFHHKILPFPAVSSADSLIEPGDSILLCGSCFSENVGSRLRRLYHPVVINPLGIAFDPASLLAHFEGHEDTLSDRWIFERDGVFFSWYYHSTLYSDTRDELIGQIKAAHTAMKQTITESRAVVITLGTAFSYILKEQNLSVANCHKMPSHLFEKKLMPVDEITSTLIQISAAVRRLNPRSILVFTVSPVKHLRDGIVENTRSKAHLLSAVHDAVGRVEDSYYFPSFEIITEVLRNYEYYEDDMAHPTDKAVDAVFDYFVKNWFSENTKARFKRIDQFLKNLYHHVRIPEAHSARQWFERLKDEKQAIETELNISLSNADQSRWDSLADVFSD